MEKQQEFTEKDQLTLDENKQIMLGACITQAVDIKALMELYAYRIIGHEQFIQRSIEITREFHKVEQKFK